MPEATMLTPYCCPDAVVALVGVEVLLQPHGMDYGLVQRTQLLEKIAELGVEGAAA